jgi:hypothetical protein
MIYGRKPFGGLDSHYYLVAATMLSAKKAEFNI